MGKITSAFDPSFSYGFEGGPSYESEVVALENGFEKVDSAWQYARHRYTAKAEAIDDEQKEYYTAVFHACRGRLHSFQFLDWNDYVADREPLHVSAGTTKKVQLYKTYSFGNAKTIRPVQALVPADPNNRDPNFRQAGPKVYSAGGNEVAGTFNFMTGEFTPAEAWGSGEYSWSGWFYVWVRFDSDDNTMTINSWNNSGFSISLIEKKYEITADNVPQSWAG